MTQQTTNLAWFARLQERPFPWWITWAVFLILPMLMTLLRSKFLADDAYLSMRFAQTTGHWDGFVAQLMISSLGYTPLSPVYWVILTVPEWLGWPVAPVAAVMSALGWGITAVIWQKLLSEWRLPVVNWLIPLLLVVSPVMVMTRGSLVSWFMVLAWWAIWLTVQQKWGKQTIVLLLLPLVSVSITAVALIAILVFWRIVLTRKIPWLIVLLLAAVIALLLMGIFVQSNQVPAHINFPFADWSSWIRQWLYADSFVWLFVVFAFVAVVGKRQTWSIAVWLFCALLDVNLVGQTVLTTGLYFLAGVGIALIAQWLVKKQWFEFEDRILYLGTVMLLCLPLVWVMVGSLRNRHDFFVGQDEEQIGIWLQENSDSDAIIVAEPNVGYWGNRTVWSWNGRSNQQNWADFIRALTSFSPEFIITDETLFWDGLVHQNWWKARFRLVQSFGSLDIWRADPQPVLKAKSNPLNVVLENGVKLVGYQQFPQSIKPGNAIHLSLHFQAEEPVKAGFDTVIWLKGAGQPVQADQLTPRGVPSNWWEPGQTVTAQYVLPTTEELAVGGYRLMIAFRTQDSVENMPVHQNEDSNPLDRIQLGYVAVPENVRLNELAMPFDINFGDEFKLVAADLPEQTAHPGDAIDLTFYWEAVNPNRPQHDYTIFVHLLNDAGELVANADGFPQGGQYPTGAWVPGDLVADGHRLVVPPDLASGHYEIRMGAYLLETGERLPVLDEAGNELPGANLLLIDLTVE